MTEKKFHAKRERTDLDPRMIVGAGYGEFEYVRYNPDGKNEYELWSFETEALRSKFIKDYGGEVWLPIPAASSYGYGYSPPPSDPDLDCDPGVTTTDLMKPGFAWDRK